MQRILILPVSALLVLSATGCSKVQARADLKKGNSYYTQEQYAKALDYYQRGLKLDPDATFAWRSLGFSALALYRPGDEDPKNKEYGDTAIKAFQKYLEENPEDTKVEDYLMATYVNAGHYDEALQYLDKRAQENPADAPKMTQARLNILLKAERMDEALKLVPQLPAGDRATALYSIGVTLWKKVYQDKGTLSFDQRSQMITQGINAEKAALDLKPDYSDAMFYYGLLYREQAKIETDGAKRLEDEKLANEWATKGAELMKKKAAQPPQPAAAPANT
jgi:tetratricopeptide (TPR) repeat protein